MMKIEKVVNGVNVRNHLTVYDVLLIKKIK